MGIPQVSEKTNMLRWILVGIGLISTGLLAGILMMLLMYPAPRGTQRAEIRLVERTETSPKSTETLSPVSAVGRFREVAQSAVQSVVLISPEFGWYSSFLSLADSDEMHSREGSGVVITPQGHILTNYHVIEQAETFHVLFADRREYEAYLVGGFPSTDLAVIQIVLAPGETVQPMTLGDSETLQPGDWVLAVGNPLQLNSTVTAGIVSAVGRSMDILDADFSVENFIQTDAAINPGNSGGALVNINAELVGINTAIATNSGFYEGYGFAIPVNLAIRVANDLIKFGEFRRGYMGISPSDVDAELAHALGMTAVQGVFLDQVYRGGAAEIAGLHPGDVILEIDGHPIQKSNQLQSIILMSSPDSTLHIRYWRDEEVGQLQLTLLGQEHPGVAFWLADMGYRSPRRAVTASYLDQWGLVLKDVSEESELWHVPPGGVMIQRVVRQKDIEFLREGVLIERINETPVKSVQTAAKAFREADDIVRLFIRDQRDIPHMVLLTRLKP